MSDLKNKLIKLAYENPELREDLLPVIMGKTADGSVKIPTAEKPQFKVPEVKKVEKMLQEYLVPKDGSPGMYNVGDLGNSEMKVHSIEFVPVESRSKIKSRYHSVDRVTDADVYSVDFVSEAAPLPVEHVTNLFKKKEDKVKTRVQKCHCYVVVTKDGKMRAEGVERVGG